MVSTLAWLNQEPSLVTWDVKSRVDIREDTPGALPYTDFGTFISQRAYGLSSIMKSSVLTAALLRDGTEQSTILELRKEALVLCRSVETQLPSTYCRDRPEMFG